MNELHTELSRMCITGGEPEKTIGRTAEKLNTARHNAGRLVMTEAAYFGSVSQKDCFHDLGVEKYEICAVQDSHTSSICQEMDGRVFEMKDYEAGVTAPPFHAFCRSTTAPYFDDEFTAGETQAARAADSKTYHVSADMKYPEWKNEYVIVDEKRQNIDKSGIINKKELLPNIPNAISASTPKEKLQGYLLNSNHPKGKDKAHVIKQVLGYHYQNWDKFADKIYAEVQHSPVVQITKTEYGVKYETHIRITGETQKALTLRTVWQIDTGSKTPRLVTITFNKKPANKKSRLN